MNGPLTTTVPSRTAPVRRRLHVDHVGRGAVVVSGEIDTSTAGVLRRELEPVATEGRAMLIDLCEVLYLDSAGVSVLFDQAYKDLRLRVTEDSAVATVIRICGLIHLATVEFVPAG